MSLHRCHESQVLEREREREAEGGGVVVYECTSHPSNIKKLTSVIGLLLIRLE